MLLTWHFYGKMNSDIFSFYAALCKLERPMQLVLCKCCCWQCWDLGVVCGLGGEAGEGVSALDFSSRPRVALVTVCHPGINIIVRGQTHNPTEIAL